MEEIHAELKLQDTILDSWWSWHCCVKKKTLLQRRGPEIHHERGAEIQWKPNHWWS